jgi:uncharacterized protein with FMN-binding domain
MTRESTTSGPIDPSSRSRRSRREPRAYAAAGAATVAVIYAIGYGATQPDKVPLTPSSAARGSARYAQPQPGPIAAPVYRDGRFTGAGTSQYGDVSVEVTVRGGRIASVEITGATTFFPANAASPLIPEVIAGQRVPVDVVSGATGSSQAFQGAVQQALGKARA